MPEDVFKVPKSPARVILDVPPASPVERIVYVSELAEKHRGRETVYDLLEAQGRFLPVVSTDGTFALISKQAIRWVKVVAPDETEWLYFEEKDAAPKLDIWCEFTEGDRLEGAIYAVTPEGRQRVQDVVNGEAGFLHLETKDGLCLVNLSFVKTIGLLGG